MMKIHDFLDHMTSALGLSYRIHLTIWEGDSTPEGWDGGHIFENELHSIQVAEAPDRGFMNVLCHELAHAMVYDVIPYDEPFHGDSFQRACVEVVNAAAQFGVTLGAIYNPEIDE